MFSTVTKNSHNKIGHVNSLQIGDVIQPPEVVSGFRKKVLASLSDRESVETYFKELEVYIRGKNGGKTIGLEQKLSDGGFDDIYERAQETKEKFWKQLRQNQFSLSYQKIIYAAIDESLSRFTYKIRPMILEEKPKSEILSSIADEIFESLYKDVADIVEIDIDKSCFEGLIYFLTGNCYLKWAK